MLSLGHAVIMKHNRDRFHSPCVRSLYNTRDSDDDSDATPRMCNKSRRRSAAVDGKNIQRRTECAPSLSQPPTIATTSLSTFVINEATTEIDSDEKENPAQDDEDARSEDSPISVVDTMLQPSAPREDDECDLDCPTLPPRSSNPHSVRDKMDETVEEQDIDFSAQESLTRMNSRVIDRQQNAHSISRAGGGGQDRVSNSKQTRSKMVVTSEDHNGDEDYATILKHGRCEENFFEEDDSDDEMSQSLLEIRRTTDDDDACSVPPLPPPRRPSGVIVATGSRRLNVNSAPLPPSNMRPNNQTSTSVSDGMNRLTRSISKNEDGLSRSRCPYPIGAQRVKAVESKDSRQSKYKMMVPLSPGDMIRRELPKDLLNISKQRKVKIEETRDPEDMIRLAVYANDDHEDIPPRTCARCNCVIL